MKAAFLFLWKMLYNTDDVNDDLNSFSTFSRHLPTTIWRRKNFMLKYLWFVGFGCQKKNQTNKKKQWFLPKLDHFPWVKFTFKFKFNIVNLSFQHLTCLILKDSWGFFYFKRLLLTGTLFWVWIPTGLFQNWAISSSVLFFLFLSILVENVLWKNCNISQTDIECQSFQHPVLFNIIIPVDIFQK